VSPERHVDVARFLHYIARKLGGPVTRRRHPDAPPLPEEVRDVLVRALADALVQDYYQRIERVEQASD
jgi:hypothetical protein